MIAIFLLMGMCFHIRVACSSPHIAVIGGGIGGASASYFLKNLFKGDCNIHLYESGNIGGRMATVTIAGREYEAGASVIHPRNTYMVNFTHLLGLKSRNPTSGLLGIYNGKQFIFEESSWDIVNIIDLFWHYGWSIVHLKPWLTNILNSFSRIYELQEKGIAFSTLNTLLGALHPSFVNMTKTTFESYANKEGFSSSFIKDICQSVMLVNYGQTVSIPAFVGSVSMAGAESGLWGVHGGNKLVPEGLIRNSAQTVYHGQVRKVTKECNGMYSVLYKDMDLGNENTNMYDIVIVAAPLIEGITDIDFVNITKFPKIIGQYHRTVATFVWGKASSSIFKNRADEILTNNDKLLFNSLGKVYPVDYITEEVVPEVWKIFSKKPLTDEQLHVLFDEVNDYKVVDWLAYPNYATQENPVSFILSPGLFYTSPIEWGASAMEMSSISGRNSALLAFHYWLKNSHLVDMLHYTIKKYEL